MHHKSTEDHKKMGKLEAELDQEKRHLDSLKADHFESVYPDLHPTKEFKDMKENVAQTEQIDWELYVETRAQEERELNQP